MKPIKNTLFQWSPCLLLGVLALSGCAAVEAGRVIKTGDEVDIHFTCRLPNGEVAVTSRKDVADDQSQPKSNICLTVMKDAPMSVDAGAETRKYADRSPGFEDEVLRQMAIAVVGMQEGAERTITLTAEKSLLKENEQKVLRLTRNQRRVKELKMIRAKLKEELNKEPEVGLEMDVEQGFTGKITAVTDKEVTVAISAVPGTTLTTPFGMGTIRDRGDYFDIEQDVKVGSLVRSGALVGRISEAGADYFLVDYTNPFGGESLNCTLNAVGITKSAEKTNAGASTVAKRETAAGPAVMTGTAGETTQSGDQAEVDRLTALVSDAIKSGKGSVDIDLSSLSGPAAQGDLVTVRFTAANPDGSALILPEGFAGQGTPQELMAGKEELFPGLGEAVVGMAPGEKKKVTLPPEKAFGPRDESKTKKFPTTNKVPLSITLPADEYVKRYGGFPAVDKEVPFIPYVKARVAHVGEKDVTLAISAKNGESFTEPFGTITVLAGKDGITLKLAPKLGAPFKANNNEGVISASDGETFTVDSNHPLAGKTIVVNLEVVRVTKATELQAQPVDWVEDHDAGLAQAKKEGKPVFLLLYADWCSWCKKTMTETIPDPRINRLRDKFVWVKVNSDKETKYKQQYGQNGYPLMLVLNQDGTLRKRIDGYRDANALKEELESSLKIL